MKIKLYFILLICSFTSACYAQSEIGAAGGLNFLKLTNDISDNGPDDWQTIKYQPYRNYTASLFYKEYIGNKNFVGLELENVNVKFDKIQKSVKIKHTYSNKSTTTTEQNNDSDISMNLNYANLHLLFGRRVFAIKKVACFASISPYFGYVIRSTSIGGGHYWGGMYYTDSVGNKRILVMGGKTYSVNEVQIGMNTMQKYLGVRVSLEMYVSFNDHLALLFKPSYSLGKLNVYDKDKNNDIRGFVLTAGLSYKFGKGIFHKRDERNE